MNAPEQSRPLPARILSTITLCNPLLLLSPVCLLYGIYRAVVAPNLFATDTGNTIFNFVALAVYVLAVCVTSTLLARKAIVPDTVMLLLLNGLLFVAPFILIAHGVFLEGHLAVALGILGIAMARGQLEILKRRLPDSFVSPQLLIGAALVLATNFIAPLLFRHGLEKDNEAWGAASAYAWNVVLPLLVIWLNFIPRGKSSDAVWAQPWFAPLIYLLWVAGTSVALWTVAYVDDRHLYAYQFTVASWALAWTAFRHANLFPETCETRMESLAPICAILIPGLGAFDGLDIRIAAALYLLNLPLLALTHKRLPAIALGGITLLGAVCCMPNTWISQLAPVPRAEFVLMIVAAVMLGALAYVRDSRAGFIAAMGVLVGVGFADYLFGAALNTAVLFLFLHHLRWPRIGRDEKLLLSIVSAVWIAHTLTLEATNSPNTGFAAFVATIVVTLCLRNVSMGLSASLIPAVASILVLCLHPVHWTARTVITAPSGLIAILIGFTLLAAGAWDSARRSRRARIQI